MYVGNLMLLALNLPLVGLFVNVLRIPYAYLYPLVIMFCIIGVYEVNHSIVDVWIMLIMGVVGYRLAQVRLRSGAAGARPGDRADLRDEPAPVADHVERQLDDLLPAPDRARCCSPCCAVLLALAALSLDARPQGLAQQARRGGKRRRQLEHDPEKLQTFRARSCGREMPGSRSKIQSDGDFAQGPVLTATASTSILNP